MALRTGLAGICAAFAVSAPVQAEPVTIASLEWPPYVSSALPEMGAVAAVVDEIFQAAGHDLTIRVVPWKRAIALADSDDDVVAYFPGYACDHAPGFTASRPVGSGPLGLIERKEAPIRWTTFDELTAQDLRFGVVKGYKNGDVFDAAVAAGKVATFAAPDDLTNLLQLANGRVDAAVMDPRVMKLLVTTAPKLGPSAESLAVNPQLLDSQTMYVCFSDAPRAAALRVAFDDAAPDLDPNAMIETYMREEFQ